MDVEKEINRLKERAGKSDEKIITLTDQVAKLELRNEALVHHIYHHSRAIYFRLKGLYMIENLDIPTHFKYREQWEKTFLDADKDYKDFAKNYVYNEENNGQRIK